MQTILPKTGAPALALIPAGAAQAISPIVSMPIPTPAVATGA